MKLIYLLTTAILGLTLAGCTTEELDSLTNTQQNAIGFSALNTHVGRALLIDNSNIKNYDFNVCAFTKDGKTFMGSDDYFGGANIAFSNNKWNYTSPSDMRYWPTEENPLDFYAVSPASKQNYTYFGWQFTPESRTIIYVASNEYYNIIDQQEEEKYENIDVLYAIAEDMTKSKTTNGIVQLKFKHALAQVIFKAKTTLQNIEVDISSIKICNAKRSGIFTLSDSKWTMVNQVDPNTGKPLGYYDPVAIQDASNIIVNSITDAKDITSSKPLLVIPQELTAWDLTTGAGDNQTQSCLEIMCKIKQNGKYVHGDESNYAELYMPFSADWQPGKRYIYTLIFGGGYDKDGNPILSPINFEASTEGWVESTSTINANE